MDGAQTAAPAETDDGGRYLKALVACGDRRPLVVARAIYSATGIKLLDTGAKIDSRVFDRLFGHALAEPLDRCVTAEDAVCSADLVERACELTAAAPMLAHFQARPEAQSKRIWAALRGCPLPPAIATRLTVMRDTTPSLYEHSLRAAYIALFIGAEARFSDRDLEVLATAALLHDVGMMHADPDLFESGKPIDVTGRRQLFAHSITGELIAQREPLLNPVIARAIAQHHERLDGGGYPRGLVGDAIGKFGRVLMLVEVVLAVLEHGNELPELKLSLILRLNHRGFDGALSGVVLAALPRLELADAATPCDRAEHKRVEDLLDAWQPLRAAIPPPAQDPASAFLDARLSRLRRWLAEAGLGNGPEEATVEAADQLALVCAEVSALWREALWHARQIAYDAVHRWPEFAPREGIPAPAAAGQWIAAALSVQGGGSSTNAAAGTASKA